jgi:N-acetylglucosamine-6-phosphate deacetylase
MDVEVFKDGHLGLPNSSILAGAGYLLDWDIAHFIKFTGNNLAETIPLCTINPTKIVKISEDYGKLKVGAPSNLTLFNYHPGDDRLQIIRTICNGKII